MDRSNTVPCVNCKRPVVLLTEQIAPSFCLLCQQKAKQGACKMDPKQSHNVKKNEPRIRSADDVTSKRIVPILETKEQIESWISERKIQYKAKILRVSRDLEEGELGTQATANVFTFAGAKAQEFHKHVETRNRVSKPSSFDANNAKKIQRVSLYESESEEPVSCFSQNPHDVQSEQHSCELTYSRWRNVPSDHNVLLSMIQYIIKKHTSDNGD